MYDSLPYAGCYYKQIEDQYYTCENLGSFRPEKSMFPLIYVMESRSSGIPAVLSKTKKTPQMAQSKAENDDWSSQDHTDKPALDSW